MPVPAANSISPLCIGSLNVHAFPWDRWQNPDNLPRIAATVEALAPEVRVLMTQELWRPSPTTPSPAPPALAQTRFGNAPRNRRGLGQFGFLDSGLSVHVAGDLEIVLHKAIPFFEDVGESGRLSEEPLCEGFFGFGDGDDCMATKGFTHTRLRTHDGIEIDVYNLHADAGDNEESHDVRVKQYAQLVNYIEMNSTHMPLIIGGDFNLTSQGKAEDIVKRDRNMLQWLEQQLRVTNANVVRRPEDEEVLDYFLVRDVHVETRGFSEVRDGDDVLTDHPLLKICVVPVKGTSNRPTS